MGTESVVAYVADTSPQKSLVILALICVGYFLGLALWRLYVCPLAAIPGPRLAALSFWYEAYYDVFLGGTYAWKILELHQEYGPIIRINPHEVHISDPDFHHELYKSAASKVKIDKWEWPLSAFGKIEAGLTTAPHDIHRSRRNAYQSYFSKQAIRRMEPDIQAIIQKLMVRFDEFKKSKTPIEIQPCFAAVTCDFIHQYCFQSTMDLCSRPDLGRDFYEAALKIGEMAPVLKHFPIVEKFMKRLPASARLKLNPKMASMFELRQSFIPIVENTAAAHGTEEEKKLGRDEHSKQTLLHAILDSNLPEVEKSNSRLRDEAQTMSLAGTLTTGMTLAKTSFQILSNPTYYARLMTEITSTIEQEKLPVNQPIPLRVLETLPFLQACIYEDLRYDYGTTNRHARIRPEESITYTTNPDLSITGSGPSKTYVLPPGTPVSMSTVSHHSHAHLWPEPRKYNPDRFLPMTTDGPSGMSGHALFQKYVGSFNAGTRQCVGINLAQIELLMGLGELFRRFGGKVAGNGPDARVVGGMQLAPWVDKVRDVDAKRDLVVPFPGVESKGIWIELHNAADET